MGHILCPDAVASAAAEPFLLTRLVSLLKIGTGTTEEW
jgi:hypothetical protein